MNISLFDEKKFLRVDFLLGKFFQRDVFFSVLKFCFWNIENFVDFRFVDRSNRQKTIGQVRMKSLNDEKEKQKTVRQDFFRVSIRTSWPWLIRKRNWELVRFKEPLLRRLCELVVERFERKQISDNSRRNFRLKKVKMKKFTWKQSENEKSSSFVLFLYVPRLLDNL